MPRLTDDEANAIRALRRLAKRWPQTIELWAMDGCLYVAKVPPGEDPCLPNGGSARQELVVTNIDNIPCDGGGW